MKKLLSVILAVVMVLSLATVAFAEETVGGASEALTANIEVNYTAPNGGTSPAETLKYTIAPTSVTDAAANVTTGNMPVPTVADVTFAAGAAGTETGKANAVISIPAYTSVGIYTYTITQTAGNTAGVTYHANPIKLVVTVTQGADGKLAVAAVHTEISEEEEKTGVITNKYEAGSLKVKKVVTGNLGDQTKEFEVTVTFKAPAEKAVKEAITYVEGAETKSIAVTDWKNGKASAVITLIHNETVTFTNIPYGVTYEVVEANYTTADKGGYEPAVYNFSDINKISDSAEEDTVTITNEKGATVDTGITLDSIPFVLMLVVCAGAAVLFVTKRRTVEF